MIPYGDRRDLALSGRLQYQRQFIASGASGASGAPGARGAPWRDHVVGVFVQRDCFKKQYRLALRATPYDELLQRPEARKFAFERSQGLDWEVRAIDDLHATECRAKRRRNQRFRSFPPLPYFSFADSTCYLNAIVRRCPVASRQSHSINCRT